MEYSKPTESIDDFWRSQTHRTPERYQAWGKAEGERPWLLASAGTKASLLTDAFVGSHPHTRVFVVDQQGETRTKQGSTVIVRRGALVAKHGPTRVKDPDTDAWTWGPFVWRFYGDWKEPKVKAPPKVPKRVLKMREQLKAVAAALGKARDATAEFLASEAGLKPHNLAKLLDLAAQGWATVRDGGQRYPLPKVGVRLERDYLTSSGWTVAVVS